MNLRIATLTALLLPLTLGAQTCTSHFTNQSNYQWSISGYDGTPTKLVVAPGQTVVIPYGTTTSITVSGNIPNRPYTKQFQLQAGAAGCYTVLYTGNPGYVKINKPNPGDIATCVGGC